VQTAEILGCAASEYDKPLRPYVMLRATQMTFTTANSTVIVFNPHRALHVQ